MSSFNATDLEGKCFWAQIASETLELGKGPIRAERFFLSWKKIKTEANVCISELGKFQTVD